MTVVLTIIHILSAGFGTLGLLAYVSELVSHGRLTTDSGPVSPGTAVTIGIVILCLLTQGLAGLLQ